MNLWSNMRYLTPKHLPDGRTVVNLGCGTHMHPEWNNLDFSLYARLRRHTGLVRTLRRLGLISDGRYAQFELVAPDIIAWDVGKGIPFADSSFDVVYHCHFLEHIERDSAVPLLRECHRVLKVMGTMRIVVPDLETWTEAYLRSVARLRCGEGDMIAHLKTVGNLVEQMVRREPARRSAQKRIVRLAERLLRGDARRRGEVHRWMYDFYTLRAFLEEAGFASMQRVDALTSRVEGWRGFGLDVSPDGTEYKPGSLYCEAVRAVPVICASDRPAYPAAQGCPRCTG